MPWYFFNQDGEAVSPGQFDTVEVGSIVLFSGLMSGASGTAGQAQSAPDGYLFCNGAVMNMSDYPLLGAKLLAKYGGNGTTTFGLPNMGDRFVRGRATPTGDTNVTATQAAHTHTSMTSHTHPLPNHGHSVVVDGHTHALASHTHSILDHPHSAGTYATGGPSATVGRTSSGASRASSASHTHPVTGVPFPGAKFEGTGTAATTDARTPSTTAADWGTPSPGTNSTSPTSSDPQTAISMSSRIPQPPYLTQAYMIWTGATS